MPAYLAGVAPESARRLAEVNAAGVAALGGYLASGEAVAFLGAGASAPLYPFGLDPDPLTTVERLVAKRKAGNQPSPHSGIFHSP